MDEKRLKNPCIDRISDLPDPILGLILAHLPTKHAVATSVLSTRWKTLFPSFVPVTKLDLDDSLNLFSINKSKNTGFVDFADKWLSDHETMRNVERVVLKLEKEYDDCKILSWIDASLRPSSVRCLSLYTHLRLSEALFRTLDGCASLVELELGLRGQLIKWGPPENFVLPHLKKLSFKQFWIHPSLRPGKKNPIRLILDGCPVLEDLSFCGCSFMPSRLGFGSDSVKKLRIEECIEYGFEAVIDAPNLEVFVHNGRDVASYVFEGLKVLVAACIEYGGMPELRMYYGPLADLVCACSSTNRLFLCAVTITALHLTSIKLPPFENLTCLALGLLRPGLSRTLANLLLSAPNLEFLMIEEGFDKRWGYPSFESSLPSFPACLEQRFKKIEVWEFRGSEDEIKLIEYFLKHGKVLEEVIIHSSSSMDVSISNRLCENPRQSKTCQVHITEKDNLTTYYSHVKWL